ncbi:hypothetical protein DFH09DRAFT_1441740 [Mycena vulgaris]|nr:hypothetical protein DFH09DRAFT_1441740 [Mycena vulgaris]
MTTIQRSPTAQDRHPRHVRRGGPTSPARRSPTRARCTRQHQRTSAPGAHSALSTEHVRVPHSAPAQASQRAASGGGAEDGDGAALRGPRERGSAGDDGSARDGRHDDTGSDDDKAPGGGRGLWARVGVRVLSARRTSGCTTARTEGVHVRARSSCLSSLGIQGEGGERAPAWAPVGRWLSEERRRCRGGGGCVEGTWSAPCIYACGARRLSKIACRVSRACGMCGAAGWIGGISTNGAGGWSTHDGGGAPRVDVRGSAAGFGEAAPRVGRRRQEPHDVNVDTRSHGAWSAGSWSTADGCGYGVRVWGCEAGSVRGLQSRVGRGGSTGEHNDPQRAVRTSALQALFRRSFPLCFLLPTSTTSAVVPAGSARYLRRGRAGVALAAMQMRHCDPCGWAREAFAAVLSPSSAAVDPSPSCPYAVGFVRVIPRLRLGGVRRTRVGVTGV